MRGQVSKYMRDFVCDVRLDIDNNSDFKIPYRKPQLSCSGIFCQHPSNATIKAGECEASRLWKEEKSSGFITLVRLRIQQSTSAMPYGIASKRRASSASADDLECLANSGGEKRQDASGNEFTRPFGTGGVKM
mgnify:CR=1 FL=1